MGSGESSLRKSGEEFCDVQEPNGPADDTKAQVDTSLTHGSDEVPEMYCEECEKHDNKYVPANGFCVDCVEYKCALCINYHKRHFRNHSLQDQDDMPQDFYLVKCTKHAKELNKFYCFECENLACRECRNSDHQKCSKIQHLPSFVKDIDQSKEFQELQDNIDTISNEIEKVKRKLEANVKIVFSMEAKAKAILMEHKEKMINTYNQHQKKVTDEFDQKMEETIARLKLERKKLIKSLEENQKKLVKNLLDSEKDVVKKVEVQRGKLEVLKEKILSMSNHLNSISDDATQTIASGQKCRLFLKMKDTHLPLEKLKNDIRDIKIESIQYYRIEPLHEQLTSETLKSQTTFFSFKECESYELKTAKIYKDIFFRKTNKSITSLCLLSENKLVVTDYLNRNLIIFKNLHINTKSYDEISMHFSPWAITKVVDNKAAVTFPVEGIVKLITFSDTMAVICTEDIPVGKECSCIAYCNNKFIVSYSTVPGKVQILNMSGKVLKCFNKDNNGMFLFNMPEFLTLSPDNATLYVSDWISDTVTSMTLDGRVKATYRDDKLCGPCQLIVDETGTVFVCGDLSHNVQQLSSDLTKGKILLDDREGLCRPQCIAYCQENNRLYVAMFKRIKVFNVSEV